MTREEQIIEEAKNRFLDDQIHPASKIYAFVEGARWEHDRLIENACEWLKENMYVEHIFEHNEDVVPVRYVCASASDSVDEFVNNFRKAMEE